MGVEEHSGTVPGPGGMEEVADVDRHSGTVPGSGGMKGVAEVGEHLCAVFSRVEQFVAVPLTPSTNTVVRDIRLPGVDVIHTYM